MSWRQHVMALFLAAILLAVVIATAAKPQDLTLASQVEVRIKPPNPETLLVSSSNTTDRAKTVVRQPSPFPAYEITSTGDQGAVWDDGAAYDLGRINQTSIYILYTPDAGQ